MTNAWTPGPWETDRIAVRSEGPNGRQICLCEISVRGRPYDETYDEAIANARLIAAAPDMAEATKLLASCWEDDMEAMPDGACCRPVLTVGEIRAARAALRKAGAL